MYSISPFYQKPMKGFLSEIKRTFKHHFGWGLFVVGISVGGYSIVRWANADYHRRGLKNPADFENEMIHES